MSRTSRVRGAIRRDSRLGNSSYHDLVHVVTLRTDFASEIACAFCYPYCEEERRVALLYALDGIACDHPSALRYTGPVNSGFRRVVWLAATQYFAFDVENAMVHAARCDGG